MSNIGKTIKTSYPNGFVSKNYDVMNARIEAESYDWIVVRCESNRVYMEQFESEEVKNLYVELWTNPEEDENERENDEII